MAKSKLALWVTWVICNSAGFGVGTLLGLAIYLEFLDVTNCLPGIADGVNWFAFSFFAFWLAVTGAGLFLGFAQWTVIRFYNLFPARWWIPFTALGWAIGWGIGFTALSQTPFAYLFIGLAIGFMQWFILRRYIHQSYWWLVANLVAGGIYQFAQLDARLMSLIFLGPLPNVLADWILQYVIPYALLINMILIGMITGIVLVYIFRSKLSKSNNTVS